MKSLIHIIAALMFVFASANFAPAADHHNEDFLTAVSTAEHADASSNRSSGLGLESSVHCGSPALCTPAALLVFATLGAPAFENDCINAAVSIETLCDLPPPRS